jgi:hypothetical protein
MKALLTAIFFVACGAAHAAPKPTDPLPKNILQCGGSVITLIGGRLEGDSNFSTGTTVAFKNGGLQVSYEKEVPIVNSKVGDHVLICLVFIPNPKDCPPGDARGRQYTTTNLRTLESWTLPDSEHNCGGA